MKSDNDRRDNPAASREAAPPARRREVAVESVAPTLRDEVAADRGASPRRRAWPRCRSRALE